MTKKDNSQLYIYDTNVSFPPLRQRYYTVYPISFIHNPSNITQEHDTKKISKHQCMDVHYLQPLFPRIRRKDLDLHSYCMEVKFGIKLCSKRNGVLGECKRNSSLHQLKQNHIYLIPKEIALADSSFSCQLYFLLSNFWHIWIFQTSQHLSFRLGERKNLKRVFSHQRPP